MVNKAMILKLLRDLKETYDRAYFFITHDVQAQALSDQLVGNYPTLGSFVQATDHYVYAIKDAMLATYPRKRKIRKQTPLYRCLLFCKLCKGNLTRWFDFTYYWKWKGGRNEK